MDPEAYGKQTAEALVNRLEQLKHNFAAQTEHSLPGQILAGEAAVEALKHFLAQMTEPPRD